MPKSAQCVIEELQKNCDDASSSCSVLCTVVPAEKEWTIDEVKELITVAVNKTKHITTLQLRNANRLDRVTVLPFVKLLETTTTLEHLVVEVCKRSLTSRRMVDRLFLAAVSNNNFPFKSLQLECVGEKLAILKLFLAAASRKIEKLHIRMTKDGNNDCYYIPTDYAKALGAGIAKLDSLKEFYFDYPCKDPNALTWIIQSLEGHPCIEKFALSNYSRQLNDAGSKAILTVCTTCPNIKDVRISCGRLYDISKTLRDFTPSATTVTFIRALSFDNVAFDRRSMAALCRNFPHLNKLSLEDCVGISSGLHRNLGRWTELQDLYLTFKESEYNLFISNISQIVAEGPTGLHIKYESAVIGHTAVSNIAAGLQMRRDPMKKLSLSSMAWSPGLLDLFSKEILPLIADSIEELNIDGPTAREDDDNQEYQRFFESLHSLSKLKSLRCRNWLLTDCEAAEALIKFVKNHDTILYITGINFDIEDDPDMNLDFDAELQLFTDLNRCGRRLLPQVQCVPLGLWAHVLAAQSDSEECDHELMYELVKTLNNRANLFQEDNRDLLAIEQAAHVATKNFLLAEQKAHKATKEIVAMLCVVFAVVIGILALFPHTGVAVDPEEFWT